MTTMKKYSFSVLLLLLTVKLSAQVSDLKVSKAYSAEKDAQVTMVVNFASSLTSENTRIIVLAGSAQDKQDIGRKDASIGKNGTAFMTLPDRQPLIGGRVQVFLNLSQEQLKQAKVITVYIENTAGVVSNKLYYTL
jgi:hypothetical protein